MNKIRDNKGGIIGYILIILAVVIVLGYFGFDLRGVLESPQVQENLEYAWNIIKIPFVWIWDVLKAIYYEIWDFIYGFRDNFNEISPRTRLDSYEAQIDNP